MLVTCNRCGHLCKPSKVDGYAYECRNCDEDMYSFEVTEYTDKLLDETYLDWFNNFLTISNMAMWYRVPRRVMRLIINHGRIVHLNKHKEED